jgi:hypothetical protein
MDSGHKVSYRSAGLFSAMLEHRALTENDLVQMVTGEARSPFTLKETYECLDEEWEAIAEVLNSNEAMSLFLQSW